MPPDARPPLAAARGAPLAPGAPETLLDAFLALADRPGPWLHVGAPSAPRTYTGAAALALARGWRDALRRAGVSGGDRVGVMLPNDERFVGAFFGAQLAGGVPVPLAWPVSGLDSRRRVADLGPLVRAAGIRALATDAAFVDAFPVPAVLGPGLAGGGSDDRPGPESPAFIQYTSGSQGRPRGAEISQRAAATCVWSMGQAFDLGPADVGVSWLPLFHDMGLVGGLFCPVVHGFPLYLSSPGDFLLHPGRWLARVAEARGTIAAAPDFAWRLCARRVAPFDGDLSCWRVALDGAEPVHRGTLDAFAERFRVNGFRAESLRPAYGLAEHTLAACAYDPDRPADDLLGALRRSPSCGPPLPGVEVRVVDAEGRVAAEGAEGEVQLRSGSLMSGYAGDPIATAQALVDGWLRTGDLGVLQGGQLHVTGRLKELVIHNGAKFHPYDIERAAADAAGSALAGAAAFSVPGGEREVLVLAVEVPEARWTGMERRVRGAVVDALGVRVDEVRLVRPGTLPRTTSGKVRRGEVRALWERGHGA